MSKNSFKKRLFVKYTILIFDNLSDEPVPFVNGNHQSARVWKCKQKPFKTLSSENMTSKMCMIGIWHANIAGLTPIKKCT